MTPAEIAMLRELAAYQRQQEAARRREGRHDHAGRWARAASDTEARIAAAEAAVELQREAQAS
jgi:hypothetical protein